MTSSLNEPTEPWVHCPDGGRCHHSCRPGPCFRVATCAPLSQFGQDWPDEVRQAEANLAKIQAGLPPPEIAPTILGLPVSSDPDDPLNNCSPLSAFAVVKAMMPDGSIGYLTAITSGLNLVEALGMNQYAGIRMVGIIGHSFGD